MVRILVTDGMEQTAVESLRKAGFEVVEQYYEPKELGEALKNFDIVVVRSATKIRKNHIDKALESGRLKLIIRGGVGVDNIDVAYAMENGIQVLNTPNASSASVAELTIAHMLAVARFIHISNVAMRQGKWDKKKYNGIELNGKTLGLVGFGRIAREVAKRAKAFGMKVIYTDVRGKLDDAGEYEYRDFEDLLRESDFVSLHCPYSCEYGPVIGKKQLELMKDGAYLVNLARGGVVDEVALLEALESGKLSGACIDVFEEEPTHNEKLVSHPKVSVSPHIGASTIEAQQRIGEEIVDIIMNYQF